jgi:cytochrome oxidase Cu insertion factor (SCO1/SenC/PrrC family)
MSPLPCNQRHCPRAWALGAVMIAMALVSGPAASHGGHDHHADSGQGIQEAQEHRDIEPPTVLAPGYANLGFAAPEPGSYRLPPIRPAADAEVLLDSGERVRLHEVFGDDRLVFLSFIYTVCPDAHGCPLASFVLQRIHRELQRSSDLAGKIRLVSLSFDPETDSPEVMREYARQFDAQESEDWVFLTGESMTALQPLLDTYGQAVGRIYDQQGRYTGHIAHVLRVYLIDSRKRIRNIYNVSFLHPDILLADARTLLLEDQSPAQTEIAVQASAEAAPERLLARAMQPPLGLPPLADALLSRLTPERVDLGQRLFFDRRLSSNHTLACASCHIPSQGFTQNAIARSIGMEGQALRRNASSLLNAVHHQRLYWDGREFGIDTLIWGKLLDERVMGNRAIGEVMARLRDDKRLLAAFHEAFPGDGLTMRTLAETLTDYVSTLVAADSRFDRWHYGQRAGRAVRGRAEGIPVCSSAAPAVHSVTPWPWMTPCSRTTACTTPESVSATPWASEPRATRFRSVTALSPSIDRPSEASRSAGTMTWATMRLPRIQPTVGSSGRPVCATSRLPAPTCTMAQSQRWRAWWPTTMKAAHRMRCRHRSFAHWA